jgi:hypothetical protein
MKMYEFIAIIYSLNIDKFEICTYLDTYLEVPGAI